MARAPIIAARLNPELVEHARREAGRQISTSELIRLALERVAGVEPGTYPPGKRGRKPRQADQADQGERVSA